MSTKPVYQVMARLIQARQNCIKAKNQEWFKKHSDRLQALLSELPHGSGLDYTWHYDFDKSNSEQIVLTMSLHSMDENGHYDAIIDFRTVITPSLSDNFKENSQTERPLNWHKGEACILDQKFCERGDCSLCIKPELVLNGELKSEICNIIGATK